MQTARVALGVALRVCPRTAVYTYTRQAAGMVLVHTSPPHPSGSQQNCLRPDMPYKTGHADWSGLDLGLFIGAGVLVTAGLYELTSKLVCLKLSSFFSLGNTKEMADHNKADESSKNDVTVCNDEQEPIKELMTSNSDISDQKSTSACPFGGGQVSEGNAGKDHNVYL
uniref:Uncharacterized protein n=1 Tax=Branchiostoma floridae TaxID=7739 RepID=C3YTG5_BRAFL|eukprot:XP_002600520.1 hypothetical protein BRAFLDRAFT_70107 [Branchiostoma floridae]